MLEITEDNELCYNLLWLYGPKTQDKQPGSQPGGVLQEILVHKNAQFCHVWYGQSDTKAIKAEKYTCNWLIM